MRRDFWTKATPLLELAGDDAPYADVLGELANVAATISRPDGKSAVLIHDSACGCLRIAAEVGLHPTFVQAIDGFPVGRNQPSCARAVFAGEVVIVDDVATDSYWQPYIPIARECSIGSCWSFPILSDESVLGALAVYHADPRVPTAEEIEALRHLATISSAVLGRGAAARQARSPQAPGGLAPPGQRSGTSAAELYPYLRESDWTAGS